MRQVPALIALACTLAWGAARAQLGEEVPFVTSPDNVTQEMLRAAKVGPGDHVIDLGSGDGRIVIVAAKRFGATGLGVEIVPDLVRQSLKNARDAGVAGRVDFRVQDLFQTDLSPATVVTMYLLPDVNLQLRPSLLALKPGTRIVSHDWDLGDWKPDATTVVAVPDKQVGLEKFSRVHLWVVPAKVEGAWCGAAGTRMELTQAYQEVAGRMLAGGRSVELVGRVQGTALQLPGLQLVFSGETLREAGSAGALFTRRRDGRC
jgi:SAM-dependent methyltransferase